MTSPAFHHSAAILSVGDELALGQTLDTNCRWISDQLARIGLFVREHRTVSDDAKAIADALVKLASANELIIITGGLGPTKDDLTRQGLAIALEEELREDAEALASISAYFQTIRRDMPDSNRLQALRPTSAAWLANDRGTAPGLCARFEEAACDIFCLPGPPPEMSAMFERSVLPALRIDPSQRVLTRAVKLFGLPEAEVAERLGALMDRHRNPVVGTTASAGVITCRIRQTGGDIEHDIDEMERDVRIRVRPYDFDADGESLAAAVISLLRNRAEKLCVVESCTGGLLGSMLTEVSGASDVFIGGWLTYSNEMKSCEVGVPEDVLAEHGAVSRPVARAMAEGALHAACDGAADHALSITGIAGPDGGSDAKPVGTVFIGRASRDGDSEVRRFQFAGDRKTVRGRAAMSALAMLRLHLIGASDARLLSQLAG